MAQKKRRPQIPALNVIKYGDGPYEHWRKLRKKIRPILASYNLSKEEQKRLEEAVLYAQHYLDIHHDIDFLFEDDVKDQELAKKELISLEKQGKRFLEKLKALDEIYIRQERNPLKLQKEFADILAVIDKEKKAILKEKNPKRRQKDEALTEFLRPLIEGYEEVFGRRATVSRSPESEAKRGKFCTFFDPVYAVVTGQENQIPTSTLAGYLEAIRAKNKGSSLLSKKAQK